MRIRSLVQSRWGRVIPLWVAIPLMFLGIVYVVFVPFGESWAGYGSAIFVALLSGAWAYSRYRVVVLAASESGAVHWTYRARRGEQPPPAPIVHWPVSDAGQTSSGSSKIPPASEEQLSTAGTAGRLQKTP